MTKRHLETLSFDNSYARLPGAFYAKLNPTPFASLLFSSVSIPQQQNSLISIQNKRSGLNVPACSAGACLSQGWSR